MIRPIMLTLWGVPLLLPEFYLISYRVVLLTQSGKIQHWKPWLIMCQLQTMLNQLSCSENRFIWVLILASCGTCKLFVYDNSVEFDESHCLCLVVSEVLHLGVFGALCKCSSFSWEAWIFLPHRRILLKMRLKYDGTLTCIKCCFE